MNHSVPVIAAAVPGSRRSHPDTDPHRTAAADPAAGCPQQALLTLAAEEKHARIAREFTADVLSRWQVAGDDRDSAILIVSELATNAVLHGHSEMTVRLALDGKILHVAVADCGSTPPPERNGPPSIPSSTGVGWPSSNAWRTGSTSVGRPTATGPTPTCCSRHNTPPRRLDRPHSAHTAPADASRGDLLLGVVHLIDPRDTLDAIPR